MNLSMGNLVLWGSIALMAAFIGYNWIRFEKQLKVDPKKNSWLINSFPTFCATLGVILTFVGIAIGLAVFDTSNIIDSVPQLLEGMQFAFVTSIIGMVVSAVLKWRLQTCLSKLEDDAVNEEATIADLIKSNLQRDQKQDEFYKKILENNANQNTEAVFAISSAVQRLTNSIVGDGESTLIGQIQLMRVNLKDGQTELKNEITTSNEKFIEEFRNFAKISAENNSKVFIEALNNSMKEFNNNLQEQFGENFKQLNIAVGKLLEWQEKYKDTVIEVTENQKEIFAGIDNAKNALVSMADNSKNVEKSASDLKDIIVTTAEYQEILKETLVKLNSATKDAEKFVPKVNDLLENTLMACEEVQSTVQSNLEKNSNNIQKQINTISEQVSTVVEKNSNEIKNSSTELLKTTLDVCNKTQESMELNVYKVQEDLETLGKKVATVVESNSNEIRKNYIEANKHVEKQVEKAVEEVSMFAEIFEDVAKKQINIIENVNNKSIDTINKSAESLAKNSFNVTKRVSDNIQTMVEDNNKNLKTSSENINKDFENRLNNSLVGFARELASISEKFANDYTPLTKELAKIVSIAKNVNNMGGRR